MLRIELFMDAIRRNKRCSSPSACHTRRGGGGGGAVAAATLRCGTLQVNLIMATPTPQPKRLINFQLRQPKNKQRVWQGEAAATGSEVSEIGGVLYVPQPSKCDKVWQYLGRCAPEREKQIQNLLQFTMSWRMKCLLQRKGVSNAREGVAGADSFAWWAHKLCSSRFRYAFSSPLLPLTISHFICLLATLDERDEFLGAALKFTSVLFAKTSSLSLFLFTSSSFPFFSPSQHLLHCSCSL